MQNATMDDIVKQALVKWPNVPDCYGWLGLDVRGQWYLRDAAAQAAGAFPQSKGDLLRHEKLIDFIGRNYEADARGQWYFQNGPQRVYVELERAPWILRIQPDQTLRTHTGRDVSPGACLLDDEGYVYFETDLGLGLLHSQDVALVAEAIEQGRWATQNVNRHELGQRYRFVSSPNALQLGDIEGGRR